MPKLKNSEWDPISNGVFRVTVSEKEEKCYLALSRNRASSWLSNPILKLAHEKDGYIFLEEPRVSSLAIFASEELACAVNPAVSLAEIRRIRINARNCAAQAFDNLGAYLMPPAPDFIEFSYSTFDSEK